MDLVCSTQLKTTLLESPRLTCYNQIIDKRRKLYG